MHGLFREVKRERFPWTEITGRAKMGYFRESTEILVANQMRGLKCEKCILVMLLSLSSYSQICIKPMHVY